MSLALRKSNQRRTIERNQHHMQSMTKPSTKRKPGPAPTSKERKAAIFAEIFARLELGEPLAQIVRTPRSAGMPGLSSIYVWINEDAEIAGLFARAREAGFDQIAQDALDIADETTGDTVMTEAGPRPDTEWISRSKLRVETRLKLLAKWDPKRYGDKLAIGGAADLPPVQSNVTLDPSDAYKAILGGKT